MGSDRTGGARRELLMTIEEAEALLAVAGWRLRISDTGMGWYFDVIPVGDDTVTRKNAIRNSHLRSKAQAQIAFFKWMEDGCPRIVSVEDDLRQYGHGL